LRLKPDQRPVGLRAGRASFLQRYVNESDFRYNSRTGLGYSDTDRTNLALRGITGKHLTYRRIDGQEAV
jgi:hypothetical protein